MRGRHHYLRLQTARYRLYLDCEFWAFRQFPWIWRGQWRPSPDSAPLLAHHTPLEDSSVDHGRLWMWIIFLISRADTPYLIHEVAASICRLRHDATMADASAEHSSVNSLCGAGGPIGELKARVPTKGSGVHLGSVASSSSVSNIIVKLLSRSKRLWALCFRIHRETWMPTQLIRMPELLTCVSVP